MDLEMEFYLKTASKILVISAFCWCIWVGYQIWTTPVTYKGIEVVSSVNSHIRIKEVIETREFSNISDLGATPLIIPVLITLIAIWSIFRFNIKILVIATVLLSVFWVLSGFSIGIAYTPAMVILVFVSVINLLSIWQKRRKKA